MKHIDKRATIMPREITFEKYDGFLCGIHEYSISGIRRNSIYTCVYLFLIRDPRFLILILVVHLVPKTKIEILEFAGQNDVFP